MSMIKVVEAWASGRTKDMTSGRMKLRNNALYVDGKWFMTWWHGAILINANAPYLMYGWRYMHAASRLSGKRRVATNSSWRVRQGYAESVFPSSIVDTLGVSHRIEGGTLNVQETL